MKRSYLQLLYPGMRIKRWLGLAFIAYLISAFGLGLIANYYIYDKFEKLLLSFLRNNFGRVTTDFVMVIGLLLFVFGLIAAYGFTRVALSRTLDVLMPDDHGYLINMLFTRRRLLSGPKIVAIGGGTGLSVLLRGLKNVTSNITAIVTVADDGGSSGTLRDELHIVPPGDMRNCLIALSDTEPLMESVMQHRFDSVGALSGHSLGNLFIAALTKDLGDIELAMNAASKLFKLHGKVLPSTKENIALHAKMSDGAIVVGESNISKAGKKIDSVYLSRANVTAPGSAIDAVLSADIVILGPGSLYTSVIPNLLIKPLAEALQRTEAAKIYVCNVMTQHGETDDYTASDHVEAILHHAGKVIDYAIINNRVINVDLLQAYSEQNAFPVRADVAKLLELGVVPVCADMICETHQVRHDSEKLLKVVIDLVYGLLGKKKRVMWDKLLKH